MIISSRRAGWNGATPNVLLRLGFFIIGLALATLATLASAEDRGISVRSAPVSNKVSRGNAAVFVGINEFDDESLRKLDFAVNDAVSQAYVFVVELGLISPENCWLVVSGKPSTPETTGQLDKLKSIGVRLARGGRASVLVSITEACQAAHAEEDLLLISIASHGFEDRGVAYAMPSDGVRSMLSQTGINLATLREDIRASSARKRILIVDACREHATQQARGGQASMGSAFRNALASSEGQATLASCDVGQVSLENPALGHGVFTYFLLRALHGEASADERGFITLGSVSSYVAENVTDWIVKNKPGITRGEAQHPFFDGPEVARRIPVAIIPEVVASRNREAADRAEQEARLAAENRERLKNRLSKLDQLYGMEKLTRNQLQEARTLLQQARLSDIEQQRLAKYVAVMEGSLEPEHLQRILDSIETPEQTQQRLLKEQEALKLAEENKKQDELKARIEEYRKIALANDSRERGLEALKAIDQILALSPEDKSALDLRDKINGYYGPSKIGDAITNTIGMKLVFVPGGEFLMGSPAAEAGHAEDEAPQHKVRFSKPFLIAVTHVTQAQWKTVMADNPSRFKNDELPVEQVSWDDAKRFCERLTQKDGRTYRLPTEAEWEYACRAGASGTFGGDGKLDSMGWYEANSGAKTHPPGLKLPNAWGIYDMHGQLWQWCQDSYHATYQGAPGDGSAWETDGMLRVMRGGSWDRDAQYCRSARRSRNRPFVRHMSVGFRVVASISPNR